MPSRTKKQARFMAAAAHNPAFAKKVGISQSVAKEFNQADKGRKFATGGEMKEDSKAYQAKEKRHVAAMKKAGVPKKIVREEEKEAGLKKGGCVKKMARGGGVESKGKTKGKMIVMKKGGKC